MKQSRTTKRKKKKERKGRRKREKEKLLTQVDDFLKGNLT